MHLEAINTQICFSRVRLKIEKAIFLDKIALKGLVALADQGVFNATNFLTGIIVARTCGKEQFGFYFLGWSIVLLAMELQSSLILSPYTVFGPRLSNGEHRRYRGSTLIHQMSLATLSGICLIGIAFVFSMDNEARDLTRVIWVLVLVIIFILFRAYARQACLAGLEVNKAILIDLSVAVIQIGGLLALVHIRALSVSKAFYVIGCASAVPSIIWLVFVRHNFSLQTGQAFIDGKKNLAFGKWVLAGNISTLISNQLYPWLVTTFHGVEMTGVLAACMGIIGIFYPIWAGIGNIMGPKSAHAYARGGLKELSNTVFGATILLAIVSGLFCLAIFFFGETLIVFLYGSGYAGNRTVVSVISIGVLASAITSGIDYGLWAAGEADKNFKANLFSLGITVTVGLLLVKFMGLLGAGLGVLVGNGGASIVRWFFYRRMRKRSS